MNKNCKVLIPMMMDIHFDLIAGVLRNEGYDVEVLKTDHRGIIEEGLKSVHNDMCYPALLVIGQFIDALKSGKYDTNNVALLLTQTGGGCRASNYIHLLRRALEINNFHQVKVWSLNFEGLDKKNEFSLSFSGYFNLFYSILYGDLLMSIYHQSIAYEKNSGDSKKILTYWKDKLISDMGKKIFKKLKKSDWQKVDEALKIVGLEQFSNRQISELSGGQFQRVLIARCLVQEAKYIFLDEPFVGIDSVSEEIIMNTLRNLREKGHTILIVHHDLRKVHSYFDNVLLLNKEVIAYGDTEKTFTRENLTKAYGTDLFFMGGGSND